MKKLGQSERKSTRDGLAERQGFRALVAWLQARPELGQKVSWRGPPEWLAVAVEAPGACC